MPIQRLLVACKAYDAEPAIAQLEARPRPVARSSCCRTANQQAIAERWPLVRCIFVSSTEGAYRRTDASCSPAADRTGWAIPMAAAPRMVG